ncbi:MAG TPA: AbrB/MazE/SpoVT family DNA-binding domain-containing protein [Candidatus Binataceae bacterium]|nr:AbrB/MazE/SpoVT family DNA-binding domain-containing protein [Candidatus Binataceae bacterium]
MHGMELKIDKAGRIVVPKHLRDRLGFTANSALDAIEQPDGVLLKRREQAPSMIKTNGVWVHQGEPEAGANWDRLVGQVREERTQSVLKSY